LVDETIKCPSRPGVLSRSIKLQWPVYCERSRPESLEHISTICSIQSASMATRTFHQNAFTETRGFAPTCIGLGASRLQRLWVWFLSNSVKYLDCYASNGPHSHAPHGVLALFVLVYPAAAIIKLARPTTDGATSLSSLGCRLL
jgi:hypothetical protein